MSTIRKKEELSFITKIKQIKDHTYEAYDFILDEEMERAMQELIEVEGKIDDLKNQALVMRAVLRTVNDRLHFALQSIEDEKSYEAEEQLIKSGAEIATLLKQWDDVDK